MLFNINNKTPLYIFFLILYKINNAIIGFLKKYTKVYIKFQEKKYRPAKYINLKNSS